MPSVIKTVMRYAMAIVMVAISSAMAELFYRLTGSSRLSTFFLAGVVVAAFLLGSGPAYLTSVLAFLVYMFLVDPRYTFAFGSPDDFNSLFIFLAVAVLTCTLTGRARDEAARAKSRALATDNLLAATQEFSASSDEAYIRERLARQLATAAKGEALVRDGLRVMSAPEGAMTRTVLMETAALERDQGPGIVESQAPGRWILRSLRAGESRLGVAAWRTLGAAPLTSEEEALLKVMADTGAAAISRAKLAAGKAEAEARARTEDLRNALLSSISHDLRTPLASILASASSLQQFGETFDAATRKDLATTIQEEAVRLDTFVANLLNMTRLEAGALSVQKIPFSVAEVIERALSRRTDAARPATVIAPHGLPDAVGDPLLFEQALGNVIENALRYGPADRGLAVQAAADAEGLSVEVRDEGPGVPEADMDHIFQKFFRSQGSAHKPGTGLGLSIARGLMEAMGGAIWARNRADAPSGLCVTLRIPTEAQG